MKCVLLYPGTKIPVGQNWPANSFDYGELPARLAENPTANVGVMLGPASGVIDIECDTPEALAAYKELFGDTIAPGWDSKRGPHRLYRWDDRLAGLPGVVHYRGIEFRLGTGNAHQSVIPPSTVDGVKREWTLSPKDCDLPPLPESVIQVILALPAAPQKRRTKSAAIPPARKAKIERLFRYCDRHGLTVGSTWESVDGLFFIGLQHCPFKGPESKRGAPVIIVFPDGGHCFKCFHPECVSKTWADIEAMYGPLYPVITVGNDLETAVAQSIEALKDDPEVLQRVGLIHIVRDAPKPRQCLIDNNATRLQKIGKATLRTKLTSAARYQKWSQQKRDFVPCIPSDHIVDAVYSAPRYDGIPTVIGVMSCPTLRPDGTIATKRGYDSETGIWLDIDGDFPDLVPVKEAVELLLDAVCDFPFLNERHRAAWIAQPITLVCRPAFGGRTPLYLGDGNCSGVGKGLSTDVITTIYEGRRASRFTFPKEEAELRKAITAFALSGRQYLLIDNVKGRLGGQVFEKSLTDAWWSDRLLGVNVEVDLPITHLTMATANNCQISGDMLRRTMYSRLQSQVEKPAQKTGFKYNPLLEHIRENRRALVMACLSIPYHYIKAGRPTQNLPAWGDPFQEWSDLIRNAMVWAGLPDPDTRDDLTGQVDDETGPLRQLLEAWPRPMTVAEAIESELPALVAALDELPREKDRKHSLGQLLKSSRGRVLGNRKFEKTEGSRPKWYVVNLESPAV